MPRRLAITGLYEARILEYEDQPLKPDQVCVRTELASGKHGTTFGMFDNRTFAGKRFEVERHVFVDHDADPNAGQPTVDQPWITGTTGVGIVEAIGTDVTRFNVGDRVFGLMDIRETNVVKEDNLWLLGDLDPLVALCIEPAYVSFHCIRESNIRYGDRVAVVGLGALGLLAVSMAQHAGAETIIALDLFPARRELAMAYGADYAFGPRDGNMGLQVRDLTEDMGVDVAIELSGSYAGLSTAVAMARVGGLICSAGFYQGEANTIFLGREWHHNRLTMIVPHGCGWGHEPRDYPYWDKQRAYNTIASMMYQGRLQADGLINKVYAFQEATHVFQDIKDNPNQIIKYAVDLTIG